MADLSSAALATVPSAMAGAGIAAMFPGVDQAAVVGGFCGALFFVAFARDKSFWASLGYLLSSWGAGYFAAAELAARGHLMTTGLPALIFAAVFVVLATGTLEWLRGGKPPFWFRYLPWIGGRFAGGKDNG